MKPTVLFLDQQSWKGGGQAVLVEVLDAVRAFIRPVVALPGEGPFRRDLEGRGIETLILPFGDYAPGAKSAAGAARLAVRSAACAFLLAREIRMRRAAAVYVNGPRCLLSGAAAAAWMRRPCVLHLHSILRAGPETGLVRLLARAISGVIACSNAAAGPIRGIPGLSPKTRVVYNPVREPRGAPQSALRPDGRWTAGIVGRITPEKRQDLVLKAVVRLDESERSRIRLLFVGAPDPESREDRAYAAELRNYARRSHIESLVVWAGRQEDTAAYYRAMDLLVHPSAREALGLVLLEALRHGIPVIACRTGGVPEVVRDGHNGLLLPPGDENALADGLRRFLREPALRSRLADGARAGPGPCFAPERFRSDIRNAMGTLIPNAMPEARRAAPR